MCKSNKIEDRASMFSTTHTLSLFVAEDFKDDDKNTKARARKGVKTDVPSSEQKKVSTNQNTKQPY